MLLDPKSNETDIEYWQRQNKSDDEKLNLFCQSCCYCYPDDCNFIDILRPYDRLAETCPDFIPKDLYKAKTWAKCYLKRLTVDPNYKPLPDGEIWHPIYRPFVVCSSVQYWQIMTKAKTYRFFEKLEIKEREN